MFPPSGVEGGFIVKLIESMLEGGWGRVLFLEKVEGMMIQSKPSEDAVVC